MTVPRRQSRRCLRGHGQERLFRCPSTGTRSNPALIHSASPCGQSPLRCKRASLGRTIVTPSVRSSRRSRGLLGSGCLIYNLREWTELGKRWEELQERIELLARHILPSQSLPHAWHVGSPFRRNKPGNTVRSGCRLANSVTTGSTSIQPGGRPRTVGRKKPLHVHAKVGRSARQMGRVRSSGTKPALFDQRGSYRWARTTILSW